MKRLLIISLILLISFSSDLIVGYSTPESASAAVIDNIELTDRRTRTSKTYWLGQTPDGNERYSLSASIGSIHYEENGQWLDIESDIKASAKANWDWEVEKGHWKLLIKDDTSVAVGKDGHWIGFRYEGFAYLDKSDNEYVILQNRQNVEPVVEGNKITWTGIFHGVNLEYIYGNDHFKENLIITQAARDWLSAHPPSSYGLNNQTSYLVGYVQCDWRYSYQARDEDGNSINWTQPSEFQETPIHFWHPVKNYIVSALPVDYAYSEDITYEPLKLRKRFIMAPNGNTYLLFGAPVTDLNQFPDGNIIFDPTVDEAVDVGANDGRRYTGSDGFGATDGKPYLGYINSSTYYHCHQFARWDGITISGTIDTSYVEFYIPSIDNTPEIKVYGVDEDNPAAPTDASEFDADTLTSASIDWDTIDGTGWETSPSLNTIFQELVDSYTISSEAVMLQFKNDHGTTADFNTVGNYEEWGSSNSPQLYIEYTEGAGVSAPTVETLAASNIEATTATIAGNITATGGENPTHRGHDYSTVNSTPFGNEERESGNWTTGYFSSNLTGLSSGTTYYYLATANNSGGTGNGTIMSFLTKPAAPTNVAASDGSSTDNVVVTWTKSTGATGYYVFRDSGLIDTVGDVATATDTGADAGTITPGTAAATDGSSTTQVTLTLSGEGSSNGTSHTYKVRAYNASGNSTDSSTDTGYRGVGAISYQWWRSSGDADSDYSEVGGATSDPYDDTAAPAPTVTAGTAAASDNTSTTEVTLEVSGETGNNGDGRYYLCELSADGAASQNSTTNRGYRGTDSLSYQWMRSSGDADSDYSNIAGGTTDPYDDTGGATDPDGRYYKATISMSGADSANTTADRGYMAAVTAPTVTNASGATNVSHNSARINGDLTDDGGESCNVTMFWGDNDGGSTPGNWDNSIDKGSLNTGTFYSDLSSLNATTQYFYICRAINTQGTDWADTTSNFTTSSTPTPVNLGPPSGLRATYIDDHNIRLDWIPGVNATYTYIVGKYGSYPEYPSDGYVAFNGTGGSANDKLVDLFFRDENVYYTAWSENPSTSFSSAYARTHIGGVGMNVVTQLLAVAILLILAFWKKGGPGQVLYIIAGLGTSLFGLAWFDSFNSPAGFAMSTSMFALGTYCFAIAIYKYIKGQWGAE